MLNYEQSQEVKGLVDKSIPTMAMMEMACVVPNCDMGEGAPYKTEKVDATMAWAMLQTHIALAHKDLAQADTGRESRPQAERVKRPMLSR